MHSIECQYTNSLYLTDTFTQTMKNTTSNKNTSISAWLMPSTQTKKTIIWWSFLKCRGGGYTSAGDGDYQLMYPIFKLFDSNQRKTLNGYILHLHPRLTTICSHFINQFILPNIWGMGASSSSPSSFYFTLLMRICVLFLSSYTYIFTLSLYHVLIYFVNTFTLNSNFISECIQ